MNKLNLKDYGLIFLFVSVVVFLAYSSGGIWFDESYSLAIISRSWSDIIQLTGVDFHPPLYYFITKLFLSVFGNSILAHHLLAIIPVLISLIISTIFLKKNIQDNSFLWLGLIFLASAKIIIYSIDIRMYAWAMLWVTTTFVSIYEAIKTDSIKWYFLLFIAFTATFYTQYFAGVLVGVGYVTFIIYCILYNKRKLIPTLFIALASFLVYLPWLLVLKEQIVSATGNFWIGELNFLGFVKICLSLFTSGGVLSSILFFGMFAFSLIVFVKDKNKTFFERYLFMGLLVIGLYIALITLLSVLVKPLLISRYLFPGLGVILIFISAQLTKVKKPGYRWALLVTISLLALNNVFFLNKRNNSVGFQEFYESFSNQLKPGDILVFDDPSVSGQLMGVIGYLFPGHIVALTNSDGGRSENFTLDYPGPFDLKVIKYEDLNRYKDRKKWVFIIGFSENKKPEKYAGKQEPQFIGEFGWSNLITGYDFSVYEIKPEL